MCYGTAGSLRYCPFRGLCWFHVSYFWAETVKLQAVEHCMLQDVSPSKATVIGSAASMLSFFCYTHHVNAFAERAEKAPALGQQRGNDE